MTSNQIYQPTLLEKLLGKNYKWWYAVTYDFKLAYQYRTQLIIALLRFFIPVLVTYVIINSTAKNPSFSFYILGASFFYQIFAFVIGPSFDIANHVITGKFSTHQLRPSNYFIKLITQIFGFNFILLITRLIVLLVSAYFLQNTNLLAIPIQTYIALAPFIIIILILGFIIEVILGSMVFFQQQTVKNIIPFVFDLLPFLSGSLIPFDANPYLNFLKYTPFSYYAYHPMQIYLGKYDTITTTQVFAGGLAWCFVLYFLAKFVFKAGLKRNEAVGL